MQDFFLFFINKCCHSSKANILVIEKDDIMERQLWSEFRGKGNNLFDKVEEKSRQIKRMQRGEFLNSLMPVFFFW